MSPLVTLTASFLLTYFLHSLLVLGALFLLFRLFNKIGEATRDILLKSAVIGSVITAGLATALNITPLYGSWILPIESTEISESTPLLPNVTEPETLLFKASYHSENLLNENLYSDQPILLLHQVNSPTISETPPPPVAATSQSPFSISTLLQATFASWASIFAILFFRYSVRYYRFLSRLKKFSRPVEDFQKFNPFPLQKYKVRISPEIKSPFVFGTNTIYLPERVLMELSTEEIHALLAHEIAHIQRRDSQWLSLFAILESLFFFQPLNIWAKRCWRKNAEFLCDEIAARETGNPLAVAQCLAKVAQWVATESSPQTIAIATMASKNSPLIERVERLVSLQSLPGKRQRSLLNLPVGVLVLAILTILGVFPLVASHATLTEELPQTEEVLPSQTSETDAPRAITVYRRDTAEITGNLRVVISARDSQIPGAILEPVEEALAWHLGLNPAEVSIIKRIEPGSHAEKLGLQVLDIVNGQIELSSDSLMIIRRGARLSLPLSAS